MKKTGIVSGALVAVAALYAAFRVGFGIGDMENDPKESTETTSVTQEAETITNNESYKNTTIASSAEKTESKIPEVSVITATASVYVSEDTYDKEVHNNKDNTQDETVSKAAPRIYSVVASSTHDSDLIKGKRYDYYPWLVNDNDYSTCWCEGVKGDGIGESITVFLEEKCEVRRLYISNGLTSSKISFEINNSIKDCELTMSDGEKFKLTLSNKYNEQPYCIELPHPVFTDSIEIKILSVYKGTKYEDTCISEIIVQ